MALLQDDLHYTLNKKCVIALYNKQIYNESTNIEKRKRKAFYFWYAEIHVIFFTWLGQNVDWETVISCDMQDHDKNLTI